MPEIRGCQAIPGASDQRATNRSFPCPPRPPSPAISVGTAPMMRSQLQPCCAQLQRLWDGPPSSVAMTSAPTCRSLRSQPPMLAGRYSCRRGLVVSEMCQGPVHERRKLRLMARAAFEEGLLQLAARCGYSYARRLGGSLQAMATRNGYGDLRLTIGQAVSFPQRFGIGVIYPARIADEDDTASRIIRTI